MPAREGQPALGRLILMTLALGCLLNGIPEAAADSIVFKAAVVGIEDGDTHTVLRNKTRLTVNILGVDAPEMNQPYGREAKRLVTTLVKGQVVTIRAFRAGNPLNGEVRFKKNRNLATELVKAGLAWTKGTGGISELDRAQAEAKEANKGLWADPDAIPPWEWRAGRRPQGPTP